jgi:hypothetical protein
VWLDVDRFLAGIEMQKQRPDISATALCEKKNLT